MKVLITQSCPILCSPWTIAHQAPLSMEFSKQEYWSGKPFPSPGDVPDPRIEPGSPSLQADSLPSEPPNQRSHNLWRNRDQDIGQILCSFHHCLGTNILSLSVSWFPCSSLSGFLLFISFFSLNQWFSSGGDFDPQGTLGNVWRHCGCHTSMC